MDFNHLVYFKKVAELQNMTRAAEELIMTQPALSRVIHNLEEEVGVKFFERSGKNIVLNKNGEIFLKYTNQIMEALEQAKREIYHLDQEKKTGITIVMRTAMSFLPFLMKNFKDRYPHITVNVCRKIKEESMGHDADFYIDVETKQSDEDNKIVLMEEESKLLISKQLLDRYSVDSDLYDFRNETFFALGSVQRDITETACRNAGFEGRISTDFASSETIHSFLETGLGVAIVPSKTWNYSTHPSLILLDTPLITNKRFIYMKYKESDNPDVAAFRDFCIQFFKELQKTGDINTYVKENLED